MPESWLVGWGFVAWTVLAALVIYVLLLVFSRLVGPRAFSQMTAFDFAVTVALGAIVGSTAAGAVGLPAGLLALTSLFTFRATVAVFRRYGLDRLVDNRPILLMWEGILREDQLRHAKLTHEDVLSGLRQAGTTRLDQAAAVVLERNGELSVLPRDGALDPVLLENVMPDVGQPR